MKNLRLSFILVALVTIINFSSSIINQVYAQNCTHFIQLRDTYGDGWNGNYVSVSVNNSTVLSNITLSNGSGPVTYSFQASNGSTIRVWRSITGSWTSECRTQIFNSSMGSLTGQLSTQTGGSSYGGTTCTGYCASSAPSAPSAITASQATLCGSGQTSQLTAQGAVGTVYWYTNSCGSTFIGTGNPITVSPSSTTTYYARNYSNNQFSSSCASFSVAVSSPTANPTASGTTICGGNPATLNASSSQNYAWYTNSNGTGQVGTGSSFTTPTLNSNTTYYVQGFGSGGSSVNQTFTYTGGMQTWTVPSGVTQVTFDAQGAQGGSSIYGQGNGGLGGRIQGTLTVTPGQVLNIFVGGQSTSNAGGYNGGGSGGNGSYARGGGGATDARIGGTANSDRQFVAGGGGGGGYNCQSVDHGGIGGGTTGGTGYQCGSQGSYPGIGGNQSTGGANQGGYGTGGSLGQGGNGYNPYGGGGGGGYYGGGGASYGGGGGGSSWGNGSTTASVTHTQGTRSGDGTITLTWNALGCASSVVAVAVNVTPAPTVSAGSAVSFCSGTSGVALAGSATTSSGSLTYSWSPSTGLSSTTVLNPTATPNANQTYTLSATANGCTNTSTVVVTLANTPSAPSVTGATVCNNQTAALSASSSGNLVTWFTNSNGTGQLGTGASFTTPTLSSTTTYYVQSSSSNNGTQTYGYTGAVQTFTAPTTGTYGIDVYGAQGGTTSQFAGGLGSRVQATYNLTAGQTINLYVGQQSTNATGGWNGGGNSGGNGRGGGGASDIRIGGTALSNRVVVAAGGGGGGLGSSGYSGSAGAAGGTTNGSNSSSSSGGGSYGNGGTQTGGGASSGCCGTGTSGSLGLGGNGQNGSGCGGYSDGYGGGGGGGYYGGGGGGNCGGGTGGGGGSSYIVGLSSVTATAGVRSGNGQIIITWTASGGCSSSVVPVVATVTQPTQPAVANATICSGQTTSLVPSGGSSFAFYSNSNLTGFLGMGTSYTSPALTANTTYYVTTTQGSTGYPNGAGGTFNYSSGASNSQIAQAACESVYGVGQCNTGGCGAFTYWKATAHVSCDCNQAPGEYEFIYSNTGYNGVGDDYGGASTSVAGQQLFTRVKASSGCNSNSWNLAQANLGTGFSGCQSSPVAVSVTVNPAITVSAGTNTTICTGSSTNLAGTASGSGNIAYSWSPSTGLSSTTIANPTATPSANQTYTLTASANGCSATSTVALTVSNPPSTPSVSGTTICNNQTATLTSSSSGNTIVWYSNSNGTGQLGAGNSFTTPTLTSSSTYYVGASLGSSSSQFVVNSLATSGSFVTDHDSYTGDDRGGIAVTQQYYYYVGDNNTVRYDMPALNNPVSYTRRDGIFSDLGGNGTMYTLWNGSSDPAGGSFTVTSVRTLNADLSFGSTTIPLSTTFTMNSGAAIFAGVNNVILFTGASGSPANTYFKVALPSGTVTNLGASSLSYQGSENWAVWGISEFDGTDNRIVYVSNSSTISRKNLTSNAVSTVQSYSSLSDMACITYAPWYNRWYWHHEGGSQFGGSSETAGYCNGTHTLTTASTSTCVSAVTPVTVTVTQPAQPTISNATICSGQTTALTASGSSYYGWYTNSNMTGLIGTGTSYTTPALTANTTYYVTSATSNLGFSNGAGGVFNYSSGASNSQIAQAACESVYGVGQCNTGSCGNLTYWKATAHVSCDCNKAPGQYEFIYSNTGQSGVGDDYGGANTSVAGMQLFTRVKASSGCNSNSWNLAQANLGAGSSSNCQSTPVAVSVTVNPALTVSAGTGSNVCSGSSVTLNGTASTASGNISYSWSPSTGLSATNVATPSASPNSTQTYTLTATANGCSATSTTTLTVNQTPATPTVSSASICAGQTAALTASGSSNYVWSTNSNGTGQLGTSASYTTPTLNANTTYYVQSSTPQSGTQTFAYTGAVQTFTAPVTGAYAIDVYGAQGGNSSQYSGGLGSRVQASYNLTAGQTINLYVGQQPSNATGGWNGGGNSGGSGQGGGGASDIRVGGTALSNRVVVAAGGGGGGLGASGYPGSAGAAGGTTNGSNSASANSAYGNGGTQTGGGASYGCCGNGTSGSFGQGGNGQNGAGCGSPYVSGWGGGGGGGYYGGAGGGNCGGGAGGGGGSSYIVGLSSVTASAGVRSGNGQIILSWTGTGCSSPVVAAVVTVNQAPAAPTASNQSICLGQSATITASNNANWYTVPSGGTAFGTATSYTASGLTSNATYYMEGVNGNCLSPTRTAVTVVVNPIPASNAGADITGTVTCGKNTVPVSASALASGTEAGQWSVVSGTGNTLFGLGNAANDNFTGTYGQTYTLGWAVTNTATGCTGNDQMTVTFNQPNASILGSNIAHLDLLWCGLTGTDWSTSTNWYQKINNDYVRMSGGAQPAITHEVFTVNQTNGGMCIGNNNPTLSISSNAEDVYVGQGITLNLTNDSLNIAGNLVNDGTLVAAIGTVNFTGSANGYIGGTGNTQLFNMRINKSGGSSLSLQQAVLVTNALTMVQGNVNTTTANLLTLGQNSSTSGNLVYGSGSIVGPLRRFYASSATSGDAGLFPVGTSAYNRYARVNFTSSPGTNQYLTVRYVTGAPMSGGIPLYNGLPLMITGAMIQNYSADGYWQVDPTGGSYSSSIASTSYDVTLFANNLTGMTTPQICRIIKSPGSNTSGSNHVVWQTCGTPVAVATGAAPTSFAITSTASTGFSWFNIGSPNGQALPVELMSFSGNCADGQVNLEWQTASEHNSLYFEVEKSRDGENWQVLSTVPSAGNSTELLTYSVVDAHAGEGNNYYRLNQVDIDGANKVYDIINVSCSGGNKGYFSTYPNPSSGAFQVVLNNKEMLGSATLSIRDTKGASLLQRGIEVKPGINLFSINDLNLAPGVYYIQVINGDQTTEVIKEVIR